MTGDWLTAAEATAILGVKPATLYAYVSRGLVGREREPGARTSRYARADVERLAGAGRAQRRGDVPADLGLDIETRITTVDPAGRLAYRGWDVADAASAGFEAVARWLWTGERTRADTDDVGIDLPTPSPLPPIDGVHGLDLVRAALSVARSRERRSDDRRAGAVAEAGRTILATMIAALPEQQAPLARATVAARLWTRLTGQPARLRDIDLLDATLVLLADHELAASTVAARVVAATRADPYLVVLAGLSALGGPRHGGASEEARILLREVAAGAPADDVIDARLAAGERIPGFGHRVYRARDPRADLLLDRLPANPVAADVLAAARRRALPFPNVDFAIASFAESFAMVDDAGEVLFAVARVAGWLAHAIEEYERRRS